MKVKYLGHSSFLLIGEYSVVTDPFADIGYEMERVKADYCLSSHGHFDHNAISLVDADTVISQKADESKGKNISLKISDSFHDGFYGKKRGSNLIYSFTLDGVRLCHMGDFGEKVNSDVKERTEDVDVLFVPVGGKYTINAVEAVKIVDYVKPKIVIPMHFKTPRSNVDVDSVNKFLSVAGCDVVRKPNEFIIDKNELKTESVIYLPDFLAF